MSYRNTLMCLILLCSNILIGQTSKGKEFWFGFMENLNIDTLEVYICAELAATGVVSMPALGWSSNFNVSANSTISVGVPHIIAMANGVGVMDLGVLVKSDVDVTVYAMNYKEATSDASIILPKKALGYKYMVSSYNPQAGVFVSPSEFMIVASEDNTTINITPKSDIIGGPTAGTTYSITLNKGQLYQGQSNFDLTGTLIEAVNSAQECKPIAVFSGNICVNVGGCQYCDHLYEAMLPIPIWGKEYIAVPFKNRLGDEFSVMASEDNTVVDVDGSIVNLNSGDSYFYFSDTEHYISSSNPICFSQFCRGNMCDNLEGDPLMIVHSSLDQTLNDIYFNAFTSAIITGYYLNVVTASSGTPLLLDGVDISSQLTTLPTNPSYSFAKVDISSGNHNLSSTEGFLAFVYGFGGRESYGYSAGNSLREFKDDYELVNLTQSDSFICVLDVLQFNESLDSGVLSFSWDFGNNTNSASSAPQVIYSDTGTYEIQFIVDRLCKSDTLISSVEVVECKENKPVFPSAFSPNSDGENDIIYVEGSSLGPFILKIFDRWGKVLFETSNKQDGWNGKYKGQPQQAGTYVYLITGTYDDVEFVEKGNFTLIR